MIYDIFYVSKDVVNEKEWAEFRSKFPSAQKIENVKNFEFIQKKSFTKFFWVVWDNLTLLDTSIFEYRVSKFEGEFVHVFKNTCNGVESYFGGVALFPKNCNISSKEFQYKFYLNKKEHDIVASKYRYPIYIINSYQEYTDILKNKNQEMFWCVWSNLEITDNNIFDLYFDPNDGKYNYDRSENHVYKNTCNGVESYLNGVVLFSTNKIITEREFNHRFLVDKKEHDLVVSRYKKYDVFTFNNYNDYLSAKEKSTTEMFWIVPTDVVVNDDFKFDLTFQFNNEYDRSINHVFLNDKYYDGVILTSKKIKISEKELTHRFLIDKKEHDIVASTPKVYPTFIVNNYTKYQQALENSSSTMFWIIWPDVEIINDTILNTTSYDRNVNHIFLNSSTEGDSYISGIILCSKNKRFTKKEFDHRYLINKTEHPIVASKNKTYAIFKFSNYKDYLNALESSPTELFWMIPNDVDLNLDFDFLNFTFNFNNQYDRSINHVFLNDKYYDGVILTSKKIKISEREIYHRFLIDKKEYPVQASTPKPFDIIFISYNEKNADENYEHLKSRFPRVKRVHGVKGIQNAHIEAANLAETDMFWVVDADAIIEDTFTFEIDYIPYYDRISRINLNKTVHVWSSKNPINDLVYGYGGVKLLPRRLTANMDIQNPDMTTSISDSFKIMSEISNITKFNTDEFSTWRSAFRECAKLSSRVIDRNFDDENDERLYIWCNVGKDRPFGEYAINGARAGKQFGEEHIQDPAGLNSINDYEWLKNQFDQVKDKIK